MAELGRKDPRDTCARVQGILGLHAHQRASAGQQSSPVHPLKCFEAELGIEIKLLPLSWDSQRKIIPTEASSEILLKQSGKSSRWCSDKVASALQLVAMKHDAVALRARPQTGPAL